MTSNSIDRTHNNFQFLYDTNIPILKLGVKYEVISCALQTTMNSL